MKKHILLIENSREGYLHFMDVLDASGLNCKVTYTSDYEHAMKMLEYLSPDIVFMHLEVTSENAFDCVRRIRESANASRAKVIIYDDQVTSTIIRECMKNGADYCIDKPSGFAELSLLLKDAMN